MPLLLLVGKWEELHELAAFTRVEGSPLERQMAVTILGVLLRNRGEPAAAWEMVREILPRGPSSHPEEALFPYATETMRLATRLAIDANDLVQARHWLNTHDQWLDWSGAVRGRAESITLLSEICLLEGNPDEAKANAVEAVSIASEPFQPIALIDAERTLGQILMCCNEFVASEAHLERAREIAKSCAIPHEKALSDIALAKLYTRQKRGLNVLLPVLNSAREQAEYLGAKSLLQEIDKLTPELERVDGLTKLTEREIEVLRMVSQGLTDAEAASNLYISPRTVSQHMRSVYNKLGVSSRTAATRWAVQNKLI
jgi:DNA-binding CsgD family transcriptional regulator